MGFQTKAGSKIGKSLKLMDDMMSGEAEEEDSEAAVTNGDDKVKPVAVKKEDSVSSVKSDASVNSPGLLSTSMKEAAKGGLTQFTKMNSKILEIVSQNNVLLLERVRDMEETCQKQVKEKDEQIKRLQNLLSNKDEQMKKLTSRIEAGAEFDEKARKFFGDNEDFYKKKVEEVNKAVNWRHLPDIPFKVIMTGVAKESLTDLRSCTEVCSAWSDKIEKDILKNPAMMDTVRDEVIRAFPPSFPTHVPVFPTSEQISNAKWLCK